MKFLKKLGYSPFRVDASNGCFVVFSQFILIGYFRLYLGKWLSRRVRQLAQYCWSPPQELEIGENLLWKYEISLRTVATKGTIPKNWSNFFRQLKNQFPLPSVFISWNKFEIMDEGNRWTKVLWSLTKF